MKMRKKMGAVTAALTVALMTGVGFSPAFGAPVYKYTPLDQHEMKTVTANSEELQAEGADGAIDKVLDGDRGTYWHTKWHPVKDKLPHWFVIDLGKEVADLGRVTLTPRQSSNGSGRLGQYEVLVSTDTNCADSSTADIADYKSVKTGEIDANKSYMDDVNIDFAPVAARCVQVTYLGSWGGNNSPEQVASLAEFNASTAVASGETIPDEPPAPEPKSNGIISVTSVDRDTWKTPSDTPASTYIDKEGNFHFSQAHANYGVGEKLRQWQFYAGTNMDDAKFDKGISGQGTNLNTTDLCNNSPTGIESTYSPDRSHYTQRNFCDITNLWVDPDTGDWYGLVHNEFTPKPFDDGLHFDSIDYAVSHDGGKSWTIPGHAITSPYSTKRGDTEAFPESTYHYGDGDPRLYVDYASGYFYAFYGSRIVNKYNNNSWVAFHEHVARAPISGKMATGTWQKWYDGKWEQPGIQGKESNIVPVTADNPNGYTPTDKEYDPKNPGWASEQISKGLMPPTSPLFVMDITYNAYLGLYIGQPQHPDQSGKAPQEFYASNNLATQKWVKIADTGDAYKGASWYRWFLDTANKTNTAIVGKDFRSYCSFGCSDKPYGTDRDAWSTALINLTINSDKTYLPVDGSKAYTVKNADGSFLTVKDEELTGAAEVTKENGEWKFMPVGDGSYNIIAPSGKALGVDSTDTKNRAWGTKITMFDLDAKNVGQQWFVVPATDKNTGERLNTFRLINRYSTLALGINEANVASTPQRSWDNTVEKPASAYTAVNHQLLTLEVAVDKIEKLEAEKAELEKQLDQANKDKETALAEKKQAEDAAQKAKEDLTKVNDELAELQEQYEKAVADKEVIKTKIDELTKQKQALEEKVKKAEEAQKAAEDARAKAEGELTKLQEEFNKLTGKTKDLVPNAEGIVPNASDPASCTVTPFANIVPIVGVDYSVTVDGKEIAPVAGDPYKYEYPYGKTIVVKATEKEGFSFKEGVKTEWSWTAPTREELKCEVPATELTPAHPVIVDQKGTGKSTETDKNKGLAKTGFSGAELLVVAGGLALAGGVLLRRKEA